LLLATAGITYDRAGNIIKVVNIILLDGENISFDANLVYINSTRICPIIIMNRMYEHQNLLYIFPLMMHTVVVCINPMAIGCFICVNISLVIILVDISIFP
jgi:hypothetical protein